MVNKKIKAPIGARPSKTQSHQGAEPLKKAVKTPKAPRVPRAPRAPRAPAQPKKAPTQNVYIYAGGGYNPTIRGTIEPQVYSNIPQQFIQQQPSNPFLTVNQPINQPTEPVKGKVIAYTKEGKPIFLKSEKPIEISTQTEINDEDRLERIEKPKKQPKQEEQEIQIPNEPEESLLSELFTTQKPLVSEPSLEGEKGKSQKTVGFLNWKSFNPDYNKSEEEKELNYRLNDDERLYREQQRYLGEVKDTKANPEGNIFLLPPQQENLFIPSEPVEVNDKDYFEYIPIPEQQSEYERLLQRTREFHAEEEKKPKQIIREVEEEEVEEIPEFPVKKVEVIQREQPAEELQAEELQAVYQRIAQKEKELEEPFQETEGFLIPSLPTASGIARIEELGQRAEAVSPIQAEVIRNPVGKPKGGVIEEYIPQPNNDLEGEEEAIRMAMYDELVKGKSRDQLANEITAFTEKNPWSKSFRDERGNKIAKTSETMRDEFGNPIKTASGKGNRQRDFNVGEMKSILDKLVIEKIKRERK